MQTDPSKLREFGARYTAAWCKIALPEKFVHTQNRFPDSDSASSRRFPSGEEARGPVLRC